MVAGWRYTVGKPWAGVHVSVMVRRLNTSSEIRPLSGWDQHTKIIPVVHGLNAQEQVKFWSISICNVAEILLIVTLIMINLTGSKTNKKFSLLIFIKTQFCAFGHNLLKK